MLTIYRVTFATEFQKTLRGIKMRLGKRLFLLLCFATMLSLLVVACSSEGETDAVSDTSNTEDNESNENNEENNNESNNNDEAEASEGEPVYGGDIVYGITGNPTTFNPLYSVDTASSGIFSTMFEGLVAADPGYEPLGRLATDWEMSDDGLTFTFHLRENVKFHDGSDFTADDVVFTYSIPLHEDYAGARAADFEDIDTIEALDSHTVKIVLSEPNAKFLWTMSYGILPKHILEDVPVADLGDHEFNFRSPIGTGPFKFDVWEDGQFVRKVAFEDYWDGRPYLDSLTHKIVPDGNALLAQLQAGDVQMMAVDSADIQTVQVLEERGSVELASSPALNYQFLGYNLRNELFQNVNVRRALTHALDRDAIVANVLEGDGTVAHSPISILSWAYNPNTTEFPYDVELAKEMLAAEGWTPGSDGILEKDGKRFAFEMKVSSSQPANVDIATIAQQMFSEIGVEATPRVMEFSAVVADITSPNWNFDTVIIGFSLGTDPDPTFAWHSKEIESGLNVFGYSNEEVDNLIDKSLREMDIDKRQEQLFEIFEKIALDQAATMLYYPNNNIAIPANLENYTIHSSNSRYLSHTWWLSEQ